MHYRYGMTGLKIFFVKKSNTKLNLSIISWNVAGIVKKDNAFWKGVKDNDIILLSETWLQGKHVNRIDVYMTNEYLWKIIPAHKHKNKGRAIGGMVCACRKELKPIFKKIKDYICVK